MAGSVKTFSGPNPMLLQQQQKQATKSTKSTKSAKAADGIPTLLRRPAESPRVRTGGAAKSVAASPTPMTKAVSTSKTDGLDGALGDFTSMVTSWGTDNQADATNAGALSPLLAEKSGVSTTGGRRATQGVGADGMTDYIRAPIELKPNAAVLALPADKGEAELFAIPGHAYSFMGGRQDLRDALTSAYPFKTMLADSQTLRNMEQAIFDLNGGEISAGIIYIPTEAELDAKVLSYALTSTQGTHLTDFGDLAGELTATSNAWDFTLSGTELADFSQKLDQSLSNSSASSFYGVQPNILVMFDEFIAPAHEVGAGDTARDLTEARKEIQVGMKPGNNEVTLAKAYTLLVAKKKERGFADRAFKEVIHLGQDEQVLTAMRNIAAEVYVNAQEKNPKSFKALIESNLEMTLPPQVNTRQEIGDYLYENGDTLAVPEGKNSVVFRKSISAVVLYARLERSLDANKSHDNLELAIQEIETGGGNKSLDLEAFSTSNTANTGKQRSNIYNSQKGIKALFSRMRAGERLDAILTDPVWISASSAGANDESSVFDGFFGGDSTSGGAATGGAVAKGIQKASQQLDFETAQIIANARTTVSAEQQNDDAVKAKETERAGIKKQVLRAALENAEIANDAKARADVTGLGDGAAQRSVRDLETETKKTQ